MRYREALPKDLDDIVSIHVKGSQSAYTHILPEAYLRDVTPIEKFELWRARIGAGVDKSRLSVTVADESGDLAGFVCFQFDHEVEFGTYLHNIYVDSRHHRRGVASGLIAAAIASFNAEQFEQPIHLLVFAANVAARAFYDRLDGNVVEQIETTRLGSGPIPLCRYQWASATQLRQKALRSA